MKIPLIKIRYVLFSLLLAITVSLTFIIFDKYHNMTTVGFINDYPYFVSIYIGIIFFIIKKKWADFISLIILTAVFAVDKIFILVNSIDYCKRENLNSIKSCSQAVIPFVFGRYWLEDSLNIILVITIIFLLVSLLKKNKVKFE